MHNSVDDQVKAFAEQFPIVHFEKGATVCRAGEPSTHFFFLETGVVKMVKTSVEGQNLVLNIFYPGACVSLLTLINKNIHAYDLVCLTEVSVRKIPALQLTAFIQNNGQIGWDFQLKLLKGLQGLLTRIEQSVFVPAYNQVAGLLLYFGRHFRETNNSQVLTIRLTHQEIAEWLGLTRENVSLQLKKLERAGLISKQHNFIELVDEGALHQLAEPAEQLTPSLK